MNELISIIIATYNHAQYIDEALQSLLNQTFENWECIVINDGSNDNTEEIVNRFINKDARIKYYYQENSGESQARNNGFKKSKGNYILFFDSDDLLKPKHIEKLIKIFYYYNVDIVFSDTQRFVDRSNYYELTEGYSIDMKGQINDFVLYNKLFNRNFITIHSALMKRSVFEKIGGFNNSSDYLEDYAFWLNAAFLKFRFFHIKDKTALYRVPDKNTKISEEKILGRKISEIIFLKKYYDEELISYKAFNKRLEKTSKRCIRQLIANNYNEEAKKEISEYLMQNHSLKNIIRAFLFKKDIFFSK